MGEAEKRDATFAAAMRELTAEVRKLRDELRASREKQVRTRRVKTMRAAVRLQDVPVDDIAAAAARRAIAKLGG